MSVYASTGNERKASSIAWNAYLHIKNHLENIYDTCTDEELNNMIHNVEELAAIVESPTMDLLSPYDEKDMNRKINYEVERGNYPKL